MTDLTYKNEHADCYNLESSHQPSIELFNHPKDTQINCSLKDNEIIFVLKGAISLSYDKNLNRRISAGQIFLLPLGATIKVKIEEDTQGLKFRINSTIQLCDRFPLEKLFSEQHVYNPQEALLEINERVQAFLDAFIPCMEDGLSCRPYFETKARELFFLFRAYYTKQQLANFFQPLLSANTSFSDFVMKNYHKVKTVQEFAEISNYSQSGFEKLFKRVFGVSPYKWMKEKRANKLYHELNCSSKSLKEICSDFEFSSLSQLNDFCKENFGLPPGKIRSTAGRVA